MVDSFETKLKRVCETKGLSLPQICEAAGLNYKTLMAQLGRKSRIPLDSVDDLCHALDLPMNYFSKYAPSMGISSDQDTSELGRAAAGLINAAMQAAHMQALRQQSKISTMDVLNWLRRTDARLEDYDALRDSVDLFHVMGAQDRIPNPYRIGKNSLSTQKFELNDENHYRSRLADFHPSLLENIKKGRIEASYRPYMIADVQLRALVAGKWITDTYCRLTAKVFLPDGKELTLVHAERVPNTRQSDHEATDLDLIQPRANPEASHQADNPSK